DRQPDEHKAKLKATLVYQLEEAFHMIHRYYCRAAVSSRAAAKSKDIVRPSNALAMWKLKGLYADDWFGPVGTSGTPIAFWPNGRARTQRVLRLILPITPCGRAHSRWHCVSRPILALLG